MISFSRRCVRVALAVGLACCVAGVAHAQEVSLERERLGDVQPRSSTEIEASPWGVQFNVLPPHVNVPAGEVDVDSLSARIDTMLARAEALGVKWARVSVNWSTIEDRDGKYHWEYLDRIIEGLSKRGIQEYVCITGGHARYAEDYDIAPTENEEAMNAWLDMVEALGTRYGDRVQHWEIWNEPNTVWFWEPEPDASAYARLLKASSKVLRRVDPGAVILGGSLARVDYPFAEKLFARGVASHLDVLTFHPYHTFPEASLEGKGYQVRAPEYYRPSTYTIGALRGLLESQPQDIELWQAECGYPSEQHSHGWTGTGPWGERIQAKWLLRRHLVDLSADINVSGYFSLKEYKLDEGWQKNAKGLLRYESWSPKPSYHVFQRLTGLVRGEVSPDTVEASFSMAKEGSFYGARADDVHLAAWSSGAPGTQMVAYWLPWRMQEFEQTARVELRLRDASFEDPVLVDLLNGSVYALESKKTFSTLPLADYPMVIAERDAVPLRPEEDSD